MLPVVRLLFTVRDVFSIQGRGIALVPERKPIDGERFRVGDSLRLRRPDGTEEIVEIGGIERVPAVDVRKLRRGLGLSQAQFATRFGFSLDSNQNWEQGHRQPEGPARTLLSPGTRRQLKRLCCRELN
jgi:hypothetical protein